MDDLLNIPESPDLQPINRKSRIILHLVARLLI